MVLLNYLILISLSVAPISEVRGAIVYGLSMGLNPLAVFIIATIFNILIIPIIFWFLSLAHFNKLAMLLFGKSMYNKIKRNSKKFEKYGELALFSFVAVPLPVTGAYTGVFLAYLLNFNRRASIKVISAGVIVAGLITFFSTQGVLAII